jgi:type IX secretion system PorP/SprF family membrane protein
MIRKILISALFILTLVWNASAQLQVGQGINDFYNKLPEIHNLALIPRTPVPAASLIAGSRLDGFGHHPMQASLLCSGFLIDRLGAGLRVNYEKMGLSSKTDIQLGLTYYVFLTKESSEPVLSVDGSRKGANGGDKFSFFIAGHFIQDKIDQKGMYVLNPNDPSLVGISDFSPNGNASAGIAFLRENTYYAGVSAYQLVETKSTFMSKDWNNVKKRHYYIQGSYTIHLNKKQNLDLEVLGIGALVDFHAYQWEGGTEFKFKKLFSVGAACRSNGSLKFDIGAVAQSWDFGYAFSYGAWVPAAKYTYLGGINNMVFVRKIFNEGRRSNK